MKDQNQLVEGYVTLERANAIGKWRWARDLSSFLDSLGGAVKGKRSARDEAAKLIGEEIGLTLRGKAYSASWVKNHVAAFAKFENEPATPQEAGAFLAACAGNDNKAAKPKGTAQDALQMVVNAINYALKHGIDVTRLEATIQLTLFPNGNAASPVNHSGNVARKSTRKAATTGKGVAA